MVQAVRFAHSGPAKAGPLTKRYAPGEIMRSANIIITGGIGVFATSLAIYAAPVGVKPLANWAMILGIFTSAAIVSCLYALAFITHKFNNTKPQIFALIGYFISLLTVMFSGGSFALVYLLMEQQGLDFLASFNEIKPQILGGYCIAAVIFSITFIYLRKRQKQTLSNVDIGA